MKKNLLVLFLFISPGISNFLAAQDDPTFGHPDLLPPSPTASSLGQYADIPVSLYTGVPEINIPLFDIKSGSINLPISLSYHASGIKVEQTASWVGLGWAMNAGGLITRSVRGLPDDLYHIDYSSLLTNANSNSAAGYLYCGSAIENLNNNPITNSNLESLTKISDGGLDGEPDQFYFNFLGYTGSFIFDANGQINLFSKQKLKIIYIKTSQGPITAFNIVTENGTILTFDKIEQTKTEFYTNSDASGLPCMDFFTSYPSFHPLTYNSSWYLSSIKSPENKQITFTYVNDNFLNLTLGSAEYKPTDNLGAGKKTMTILWNEHNNQRLAEIEWESGKVEFIANHDRQDLQPQWASPSIKSKALTEVKVFNYENSLIKSYSLNYDYWNAITNCGGWYDEYKKRLKLVSIVENDINGSGTTKPPYAFEYDETLLPNRFSPKQDFWGYYNGNNAAQLFPKIYYYANDPITATYPTKYSVYHRWSNSGEEIIEGADRNPNPAFMQAGILKKIIYPTGGYSAFEYEPNTFYLDGGNYTGGGLRIKKTTTSEGINLSKNIIKNFFYKDGAVNSTGRIIFIPQFARRRVNFNVYTDIYHFVSIYSASVGGLGSTHGSPIGYNEVTVDYNGIGKTVSKFDLKASFGVVSDACDNSGINCMYNKSLTAIEGYIGDGLSISHNAYNNLDQFPFPPDPNYDFNRGNLIEESQYDVSNKLVKKITNEYVIENYIKVPAIMSKRIWYVIAYFGESATLLTDIYKYGKYYYISAWHHMSKTTEFIYDQGSSTNAIVNTKELFYNNPDHMQLTSIKEIDSKGNAITTEFKYPLDYGAAINGSDIYANALAYMWGYGHCHNVPVEKLKWITSNGSKKLLSGEITLFKNFGSGSQPQILPNKIYKLDLNEPINQTSFTTSAIIGSHLFFDNHYRLLGIYNSYTTSGNLIEMTKEGGISTNYLWSYSNTLPIAQTINAKASESGYTSFESEDKLLWSINPSPQNTVISTDAHSGSFSCEIAAGGTFGPTRYFLPSNQNGKYLVSCWVKTPAGFGASSGKLVINTTHNTLNSTSVYPNISPAYQSVDFSSTNGHWQYVEAEIDLAKIRQVSGIANTAVLKIRIFPINADVTYSFLVDDIRFRPSDAQMISYTYKPLVGTTGESDVSDQLVTYEYDEFNRLKIIRDNKGKIRNKIIYHYGN